MALLRGVCTVSDLATGSGTLNKTYIQLLAPANHRVKIVEIAVTMQGIVTNAEPVRWQAVKQTDAGTGGTANTPKKLDMSLPETIQTSALDSSVAFSVEPTTTDILRTWNLHPQNGIAYPLPGASELVLGGATRLGIRCVDPGATVDADVYVIFEE